MRNMRSMLTWATKRQTLLALPAAVGTILLSASVTSAVTFPLTLLVDGSTTVLPISSAMVPQYQAQYTDTNVTLPNPAPGSGNGICELLHGDIDVADSSRALKSTDNTCTAGGGIHSGSYAAAPTLQQPHDVIDWIIARDAMVPVVNTSTLSAIGAATPGLTKAQLQHIYQCDAGYTNWSSINAAWPNQPITVVARETTSGTYASWNDQLGVNLTLEGSCVQAANRLTGNPDVQNKVSTTPYSIGYVGLGFDAFSGLTPVAVDGGSGPVFGTNATVTNGTYPLSRFLHQMTLTYAASTRPDTYARAINWVSMYTSSTGQTDVTNQGFVALGGATRTIPDYDVDLSGKTDIGDIAIIGQNWLVSQTGHPGWIRADTNRSGKVDIADIATVGQFWLQTWPAAVATGTTAIVPWTS